MRDYRGANGDGETREPKLLDRDLSCSACLLEKTARSYNDRRQTDRNYQLLTLILIL